MAIQFVLAYRHGLQYPPSANQASRCEQPRKHHDARGDGPRFRNNCNRHCWADHNQQCSHRNSECSTGRLSYEMGFRAVALHIAQSPCCGQKKKLFTHSSTAADHALAFSPCRAPRRAKTAVQRIPAGLSRALRVEIARFDLTCSLLRPHWKVARAHGHPAAWVGDDMDTYQSQHQWKRQRRKSQCQVALCNERGQHPLVHAVRRPHVILVSGRILAVPAAVTGPAAYPAQTRWQPAPPLKSP